MCICSLQGRPRWIRVSFDGATRKVGGSSSAWTLWGASVLVPGSTEPAWKVLAEASYKHEVEVSVTEAELQACMQACSAVLSVVMDGRIELDKGCRVIQPLSCRWCEV